MSFSENERKIDAAEMSEDIEKAFRRYRVNLSIKNWVLSPHATIYEVKLKGDTRESQLLDRVSDVQLRLRLPVFQVHKHNLRLFFIVSRKKPDYMNLSDILSTSFYSKESLEKKLPFIVGYNAIEGLVMADLYKFPHLLLGGSSNSGKTVGLQSLILSLAYSKPPSMVNFILIDVGAVDLMPFEGIPHLSCPVINDRCTAYKAVALLKNEMERRIPLQHKDIGQYKMLPEIEVVIDEFQAFFVGVDDKQASKMFVETVSCLLQRGRHAKINVVIAAQNPTVQNMKVDLGNITARMAYKCAKRNYSETILGEGGAERLSGEGDMLFKSPQSDELKRIQGIFVSPSELRHLVKKIMMKWGKIFLERKFTISEQELYQAESEWSDTLQVRGRKNSDELFAKVLMWTLEETEISCNAITNHFNVGWKRANSFTDRLCELGIVDGLDAKLPRKVLPQSIADISEEVLEILQSNGFPSEAVAEVFIKRNGGALTVKG